MIHVLIPLHVCVMFYSVHLWHVCCLGLRAFKWRAVTKGGNNAVMMATQFLSRSGQSQRLQTQINVGSCIYSLSSGLSGP